MALWGVAAYNLRTSLDAELVEAARDGSKEAFAELVGRHRPMAFALAQKLLADEGLAADAVQEAAIIALVGLGRLRSPERFGPWYAGIALNTARRWLRQPVVGPLSVEHPDEARAPEELVAVAEVAARVRQAVLSLPRGQQAAVLAFYWAGLTHAEAALELGISPGAVKARLHQARASLAERLASAVEDHDEEVTVMSSPPKSAWVQAEIVEVRRAEGGDPLRRLHVVVLQERCGIRRLPIYTGAPEAIALACSLEAVEMPRPMTYQLAANLLEATGSRISEVRITRLAESTFYAVVAVKGPSGPAEIDARPSDALNVALVSGVPVLIDSGLLDDRESTCRTAWEHYPTGSSQLVAEVRERQADALRMLAEERQDVT